MKMQFFMIPIRDSKPASDELNAFLATHRIVHTERQFVADGANSLWSICVSYVEGEGRPTAEKRQQKIDYREVLPAAEFAVFAKLRALRKEISEREGLPAFALFTNEQLADMVRLRVSSHEDLKGISGVGQGRIEKYGDVFLRILKEQMPSLSNLAPKVKPHEANGDSA